MQRCVCAWQAVCCMPSRMMAHRTSESELFCPLTSLSHTDRLHSNRQALQSLFNALEHQLYLSTKAAEAAKDGPGFTVTLTGKHTTPQPFSITPQKPRPVPEPEEEAPPPPPLTAKPAPPRPHGPTKEESAIEAAKFGPLTSTCSSRPCSPCHACHIQASKERLYFTCCADTC